MARPRTVKRIMRDLLDDYGGDHTFIAQDLAMAPNRLRRLIRQPAQIAVDEERRLRDLHRCRFPDVAEADQLENEPSPTTPPSASSPPKLSPTLQTPTPREESRSRTLASEPSLSSDPPKG